MNNPKILVVGSMNMDLNIYGIEKLPRYGESIQSASYIYHTGGKGTNQAYAAALQGADITMVGRVGDDTNGETIKNELKNAGVDTEYIVKDQQAQTGLAPIMVNQYGEYFSYTVPGANEKLVPSDVERALCSKEFDMVLMQLEMPLETVYKTYELAADMRIPVFLDAGPAMKIPLERLKGIYIISPNEVETKELTGISIDNEEKALQAAKKLYKLTQPKYVILKMGARGSYVYDGMDAQMYPAYNVSAVDSTGAGDTFNAALAVKLCENVGMDEAIKYSTAAAALCVSRHGAQASIPQSQEVHSFLKKRNDIIKDTKR